MPGFDIDSLLNFNPPEYLCERCYALLNPSPDLRIGRCPVCGVSYIPTHEFATCASYLGFKGLHVRFENNIAHGQKLARVGRSARDSISTPGNSYPPMRALLEAMDKAQQFVHFTTYGISALLVGALKLTAQRIPVRGLVSGVKNEMMIRELTAYADEAPLLDTRLYPPDSQWFPHQKIIVIDGMLAFKGSANLTDFGWRKAAEGREVIEVVTDLGEITDLHNRYFSAAWAAFDEVRQGEQIVMSSF